VIKLGEVVMIIYLHRQGVSVSAIAQNVNGRCSAIDARTTRHASYAMSQKIRKRTERDFPKLKHTRRLATRYDKTSDRYVGFVLVASIRSWIRHFVNRT